MIKRFVVPAINFKDGYKADHRRQYPFNTVKVYSNLTPRKSRIKGIDSVVLFGLLYFIKDVILKEFEETFFSQPKEQVIARYKRRIQNYLVGTDMDFDHIGELHDLGYLPVLIKALPEGSVSKIGVPVLTITNELPSFYWLPNFLESIISTEVWPMTTSATTIFKYRTIFDKYALLTTGSTDFSSTWQIHDFSMRGMFGRHASFMSGASHLIGSYGTDCIGAIDFLEHYYNADCEKEIIGGSVPATEHSVMCMGTKDDELGTFRRLLDLYKTGIVSIVSDTWDLWKVLTEYLPLLKDEILARDGKVVIRPDSGDPVKIMTGYTVQTINSRDEYLPGTDLILFEGKYYTASNIIHDDGIPLFNGANHSQAEIKGVIQLLWELFGGTTTDQGYKVLDSHIGAIYGDGITFERAEQICQRLMEKGFASTNWVAGIGSYTYQYTTRDTYGIAMKATYGELSWPVQHLRVKGGAVIGECPQVLDGTITIYDSLEECLKAHNVRTLEEVEVYLIEERQIFKDPITDDGTKKSAKGLMVVYKDENEEFFMHDEVFPDEEAGGELEVVYAEGELVRESYLSEVRRLFNEGVKRYLEKNK